MVAIDFPDTPTVGQKFDKWTWNGTVWALTPTSGQIGIVYGPGSDIAAIGTSPYVVMSITHTETVGRVYRVTATATMGPPTVNNQTTLDIFANANSYAPMTHPLNTGQLASAVAHRMYVGTTNAAITHNAVMYTNAGTVSYIGSYGRAGFLMVEDITNTT